MGKNIEANLIAYLFHYFLCSLSTPLRKAVKTKRPSTTSKLTRLEKFPSLKKRGAKSENESESESDYSPSECSSSPLSSASAKKERKGTPQRAAPKRKIMTPKIPGRNMSTILKSG